MGRQNSRPVFSTGMSWASVAQRHLDKKTRRMWSQIKSLFTPEQKSSRIARLIAIENGGRARWTPRDYAALAREGYARNAIVYRAVRLIAESIGSMTFVLYEGTEERDVHPLLDLIRRPNPRQDGASLLE